MRNTNPGEFMDWQEQVAPYIEAGLVNVRNDGDLSIYNYTAKCAYDAEWNEVTRQCRGLIINTRTGEVVARPWLKFFNLGQGHAFEPSGPPSRVQVKADGSLGILYRHPEHGQRWATRGSMGSPQADAANAMWDTVPVPDSWTVLAEIIHPTSRVLVPYPFQGLVILGAVDRFTGQDIKQSHVAHWARINFLRAVDSVAMTLDEAVSAAETLPASEEGWVFVWPCGGRLKVKGAEYRAAHRLLALMTKRGVADLVIANRLDLLNMLPTHAKNEARVLAGWFNDEVDDAWVCFKAIRASIEHLAERKDYAIAAKVHGDLMGSLMAAYLGRPVDLQEVVYRREFGSKPRPVTR